MQLCGWKHCKRFRESGPKYTEINDKGGNQAAGGQFFIPKKI